MMNITFYRKAVSDPTCPYTYRWFVSWMNWLIPEANREMVCGAEDLLERLSGSADCFTVTIGSKNPNLELTLLKKRNFGGWYSVDVKDEAIRKSLKLPEQIWMCNVTRFVFGHLPKKISVSWDL